MLKWTFSADNKELDIFNNLREHNQIVDHLNFPKNGWAKQKWWLEIFGAKLRSAILLRFAQRFLELSNNILAYLNYWFLFFDKEFSKAWAEFLIDVASCLIRFRLRLLRIHDCFRTSSQFPVVLKNFQSCELSIFCSVKIYRFRRTLRHLFAPRASPNFPSRLHFWSDQFSPDSSWPPKVT